MTTSTKKKKKKYLYPLAITRSPTSPYYGLLEGVFLFTLFTVQWRYMSICWVEWGGVCSVPCCDRVKGNHLQIEQQQYKTFDKHQTWLMLAAAIAAATVYGYGLRLRPSTGRCQEDRRVHFFQLVTAAAEAASTFARS